MIATQEPEPPKPFRPVTLVLDTKQEVDAVYSLLNCAPLRNAVGLPIDGQTAMREFILHDRTEAYHRALCKLMP